MVRSMGGLSLKASAIRVMQTNTCLYLAKGMAEYVLILDLEDFFIPRGNNWNFKSVMKSIQPDRQGKRHSRMLPLNSQGENGSITDKKRIEESNFGWARDHAHPYCFISVPTEIVSYFNSNQNGRRNPENPWIGQR